MFRGYFTSLIVIVFASTLSCWSAPIDLELSPHAVDVESIAQKLNDVAISSEKTLVNVPLFSCLSAEQIKKIRGIYLKEGREERFDMNELLFGNNSNYTTPSGLSSVSEEGELNGEDETSLSDGLSQSEVKIPHTFLIDDDHLCEGESPNDYPSIVLAGVRYNPESSLGKGQDGRVMLYRNQADVNDLLAVKVTANCKVDSRTRPPIREETYWLRKAGLLQGKQRQSSAGYTFTPMKFVQGTPYVNVLSNPAYVHPGDILKQIEAIEKAIETQLEAKNIEHRDLHLGNILYDPETNEATIIDLSRASTCMVRDTMGEKVKIYPHSDRIHFYEGVYDKVFGILKAYPEYDYNAVLEVLHEKLRQAQSLFSLYAETWCKLNQMKNQKADELEILDNGISCLWFDPDKTVEKWLQLKSFSKEAKYVVRELHQISNIFLLEKLGYYGFPNRMHRMHLDFKRFYGMAQNGIELSQFQMERLLQVLEESTDISDNNEWYNEKLNKYHSIFQVAKLNAMISSKSSEVNNEKLSTNQE